MGVTPSETLADRLRRVRDRRGWSARELSERLDELGYPLGRVTIAKIENGDRGVTLDDAVALAVALDVPLSVLMFPVGEDTAARLTAEVEVPWWEAVDWLSGYGYAPVDDVRFHQEQYQPIATYATVWDAERRSQQARSALKLLQERGDPVAGTEYEDVYLESLEDVATGLRQAGGLALDGVVSDETLRDIERLGIQPRQHVTGSRRREIHIDGEGK